MIRWLLSLLSLLPLLGLVACAPPPSAPRADAAESVTPVEVTPEPTPEPIVVPVVPRAVWARGLEQGAFTPHSISTITVHHTAVAWAADTDGQARARAHTRGHLDRGWPDLAYHALIDGHGAIRMGRPWTAVGDTGTDYDPTGHFLLTLEGNFEEQAPTEEQLATAARVLAWASAEFGVSPQAIDAHRDHASTACPGERLYAEVQSGRLAARVQAVLDTGPVQLDPIDCVVALDAGHTAARPGATSARGVPEHTFNRRFLEELVPRLRATPGIDAAFDLDPGDRGLGLKDRPRLAAERGATVFLSLHHDSVQPRYLEVWTVDGQERSYADAFAGHSLFVSGIGGDPAGSERLGRTVGAAMKAAGLTPTQHHAEAIEGENRPWVDASLGLHRYDQLAVLRHAEIPALLIEAGVILNRDEEARLATKEGRAPVIAAIAQGVATFCADVSAGVAPD